MTRQGRDALTKRSGTERVPGAEVLLCERCGYVLDGTPGDGACGECGKPVAESVSERRVGSVWQREPRLGSWVLLCMQMHRDPRAAWAVLGVRQYDGRAAELGCAVACVPVLAATLMWSWKRGASLSETLIGLGIAGFFTWLGLYFMTWIESRGVAFFSKRRGWRVPPSLAWAISSHAASTWWVATLTLSLGLWQANRIENWVNKVIPASMQMFTATTGLIVPLGAFAAGMLVFETRVYQGVRACRFANVPGEEDQGSSVSHAATLPLEEE